jgi:predicted enzyme related to lactoylglutathione lyase
MKKNGVAHFEIYADDPEKIAKFYTDLFDWKVQVMSMGEFEYRYIQTVETDEKGAATQPGGINGGLLKRPAGYHTKAWVNYVTPFALWESDPAAR